MTDHSIISHDNWSLHRKGELDQQRHNEKVKEAIKNNLADIISEESVIMSDGKKITKLPIRTLDEYRFRFNYNKQKHAGQGEGGSKPGDVIGTDRDASGDQGTGGAGEEPGADYYEADVSFEELAEMVFADLQLPNLRQKEKQNVQVVSTRFTDIRKAGIMSNIDKKRTILEAIKRNAREGSNNYNIIKDDLRFKTWDTVYSSESNAVVLAMMDTSGSMGNFEKYIARTFFFWMVRFLRTKYHQVEIVFLAHHTQAKEVSEEEFFTKGESGGTKCSSVYQLAFDLIQQRYSPDRYNIYPFHFSDGDNLPSDNELCLRLINQILPLCNLFGYGEIASPYYRNSTLLSVFQRIQAENLTTVTIKNKKEIYPALKKFFSEKGETGGHGTLSTGKSD
ncbi:sporulation protein YhbH [Candidatus Formimonas warabiya]|uniref:Sporulation protein YhbH n=1 Tax=Formimonas warabiya TaxID=1761012 RepID=A0A3G1KSW0_FORW1|nr:sporulation protein YhbH [Candidatus Formimonas warabiya]ATW25539.1 sporulation protein YhbH [Candidatus Formimonas warabiya]